MMIQQHTQRLTIEAMIALEPRIGALLNEANIPTSESYWHRYSHYKRLLSQYVGMEARHPMLASSACYETMIAALVRALPEERESESQS